MKMSLFILDSSAPIIPHFPLNQETSGLFDAYRRHRGVVTQTSQTESLFAIYRIHSPIKSQCSPPAARGDKNFKIRKNETFHHENSFSLATLIKFRGNRHFSSDSEFTSNFTR